MRWYAMKWGKKVKQQKAKKQPKSKAKRIAGKKTLKNQKVNDHTKNNDSDDDDLFSPVHQSSGTVKGDRESATAIVESISTL